MDYSNIYSSLSKEAKISFLNCLLVEIGVRRVGAMISLRDEDNLDLFKQIFSSLIFEQYKNSTYIFRDDNQDAINLYSRLKSLRGTAVNTSVLLGEFLDYFQPLNIITINNLSLYVLYFQAKEANQQIISIFTQLIDNTISFKDITDMLDEANTVMKQYLPELSIFYTLTIK